MEVEAEAAATVSREAIPNSNSMAASSSSSSLSTVASLNIPRTKVTANRVVILNRYAYSFYSSDWHLFANITLFPSHNTLRTKARATAATPLSLATPPPTLLPISNRATAASSRATTTAVHLPILPRASMTSITSKAVLVLTPAAALKVNTLPASPVLTVSVA